MAQIIVSPLRSNEVPSFEVVELEVLVKDSDFVGVFDLLEVWRSRGSPNGPYEELTSDAWKPARLPKTGGDEPASPVTGPLVNLSGTSLTLILKEKDTILITFSGGMSLAQAAAQVTLQSAGRLRAYVDYNAQLVIETMEPGTGVSLRVVASDAASILALPLQDPDNLAFGKDARIALVAGQSTYNFSDVAGSKSYFYKTRFRSGDTGATSEYSLPFGMGQALGIGVAFLICGYLDLALADGKPAAGVQVALNMPFDGSIVDKHLLSGTPLAKSTDLAGHVEFNLVRGEKYELSIAGMNLVKTVTAPVDALLSSFCLVDADFSEQQDYFRVRVPQIPTLERSF